MTNLIIITGASRGFGRGICHEFLRSDQFSSNSHYILTSTKQKDIDDVKSEMIELLKHKGIEYSDNINTIPCDLSDIKATKEGFKKIISLCSPTKKYSKVIIVLNHGTLGKLCFVPDLYEDLESIEKTVNLNLSGFIAAVSTCLYEFAKFDIEELIFVNISSLAAIKSFESWGLYCSVKAARNMFMQVVASEAKILSKKYFNGKLSIKTLNYAPGPLDTDMQKEIRDSSPHEEQRAFYIEMKEQGTLLKPEQSAKKMIKLLEENSFENGAHIDYYDLE